MAIIGDKAMKEVNNIRAEKIKEYRKLHNVPVFENPDDYHNWIETDEGKDYAKELENIRNEAKGRGGYRPNAGRKKLYPDRVALNKRVSKNTLSMLKDYSKSHQISENEALDKLVNAGYECLEKNRQVG